MQVNMYGSTYYVVVTQAFPSGYAQAPLSIYKIENIEFVFYSDGTYSLLVPGGSGSKSGNWSGSISTGAYGGYNVSVTIPGCNATLSGVAAFGV